MGENDKHQMIFISCISNINNSEYCAYDITVTLKRLTYNKYTKISKQFQNITMQRMREKEWDF
jgi:hypothetical protein